MENENRHGGWEVITYPDTQDFIKDLIVGLLEKKATSPLTAIHRYSEKCHGLFLDITDVETLSPAQRSVLKNKLEENLSVKDLALVDLLHSFVEKTNQRELDENHNETLLLEIKGLADQIVERVRLTTKALRPPLDHEPTL